MLLTLLILCVSCNRASEDGLAFSLSRNTFKPSILILPTIDEASSFSSSTVAESFTTAVFDRLEQKGHFLLEKEKKFGQQFLVQMQLLECEEIESTPSELAISIHLKILDVKGDKPKIILQEILGINTLLEKPLCPHTAMSPKSEEFRISPMGLAHAKLTREIASRIEDYILHCEKPDHRSFGEKNLQPSEHAQG